MVKYNSYKKFKKGMAKKYGKKKGVKRAVAPRKTNLIKLIKSVSLKQCETKYTHVAVENNNMNHNTGFGVNGLMNTTQGLSDSGTGTTVIASRLGDEVIGRGISIKLWIANKLDRPNVMYRLLVYKYQAANIPSITQILKGAIGNKILDDVNKENVSIITQKIFNLQVGYSAYATGTAGDTDGREAHKYLNLWIPLKNKKIHYDDGASTPKFFNFGFYLIPYDSYGTLTTDNIASYAYEYKFYFKDP